MDSWTDQQQTPRPHQGLHPNISLRNAATRSSHASEMNQDYNPSAPTPAVHDWENENSDRITPVVTQNEEDVTSLQSDSDFSAIALEPVTRREMRVTPARFPIDGPPTVSSCSPLL